MERLKSARRVAAETCALAGQRARELARAMPVPSISIPEPVRNAGKAIVRAVPKLAFGEKTRFRISLAIIVAALSSSIATFLILNGLTPIVPTTYIVLGALSLTGTLVLVIIGIVGFQAVKILKARSRQAAGAGLHLQMAGIFSLVALFPAIRKVGRDAFVAATGYSCRKQIQDGLGRPARHPAFILELALKGDKDIVG